MSPIQRDSQMDGDEQKEQENWNPYLPHPTHWPDRYRTVELAEWNLDSPPIFYHNLHNGIGYGYPNLTPTSTLDPPTTSEGVPSTDHNEDVVEVVVDDVAHQNSNVVVVSFASEEWKVFGAIAEVEHLVNNEGRRLFPTLRFRATGLEPDAMYVVGLRLRRVTGHLTFNKVKQTWQQWGPKYGVETPPDVTDEVLLAPSMGSALMTENGLNLEHLKLYTIGEKTWRKEPKTDMIRVFCRYKYVPQLQILRQTSEGKLVEVAKECFEEASLIPVSQLKNKKIAALRCQKSKFCRYGRPPSTKSRKRLSKKKGAQTTDNAPV